MRRLDRLQVCSECPRLLLQLLRSCIEFQDEGANAALALLLGHLALSHGRLALLLSGVAAAAARDADAEAATGGGSSDAGRHGADASPAAAVDCAENMTLLHLLAHEVAVSPEALFGAGAVDGRGDGNAVPAVMAALAAVVTAACAACEEPRNCLPAAGPPQAGGAAAAYTLEAALRVRTLPSSSSLPCCGCAQRGAATRGRQAAGVHAGVGHGSEPRRGAALRRGRQGGAAPGRAPAADAADAAGRATAADAAAGPPGTGASLLLFLAACAAPRRPPAAPAIRTRLR